jgi:hypothetical protein
MARGRKNNDERKNNDRRKTNNVDRDYAEEMHQKRVLERENEQEVEDHDDPDHWANIYLDGEPPEENYDDDDEEDQDYEDTGNQNENAGENRKPKKSPSPKEAEKKTQPKKSAARPPDLPVNVDDEEEARQINWDEYQDPVSRGNMIRGIFYPRRLSPSEQRRTTPPVSDPEDLEDVTPPRPAPQAATTTTTTAKGKRISKKTSASVKMPKMPKMPPKPKQN